MRKLFFILLILSAILFFGSANSDKLYSGLDNLFNNSQSKKTSNATDILEKRKLLSEESATIDAIEQALSSVVTIGITKTTRSNDVFEFDPFDPFSPFRRRPGGNQQNIDQNIGSGFIISADGLIVTNKHVVADNQASYKVITSDNKTYNVEKISRDPLNDLAIIKVNAKNLKAISLGNSANLKLGQHVVAIGTPLGEFTNTVTSGIISGLKRGITAGSPFEGSLERLDNVIQTDAAISPGNSGGPLINLAGEAVGVNTAVSAEGQNIGFAIPIDVVKDLIENFNTAGGKIERPFLGIRYQMLTKREAILNNAVEGAYIIEVVENSPAYKAGLQADDIIIEFGGQKIAGDDDTTLQKLIAQKKIGDRIQVRIWRSGSVSEKMVILSVFE